MSAIDDLLNDIFDGPDSPLYAEFEGWARESRRFRAFAATYRAKIRAKLKNARHEGGLDDLRVELETAVLLLREERFTRCGNAARISRSRSNPAPRSMSKCGASVAAKRMARTRPRALTRWWACWATR